METLSMILPFVIVIGIFWFFIIRPQQKQQKQRQEMLDNLQAGDEVVTIGGIKGKIVKIKENTVRLRVSSNVDIDMTRKGIGSVEQPVERDAEKDDEKELEEDFKE
ncbi:MAG: preprotein translocase subunit YajC [Halothermotrichaceae bacterium]